MLQNTLHVLISSFFHPNLYAYQHNISFLMGGQINYATTALKPKQASLGLVNQFLSLRDLFAFGLNDPFGLYGVPLPFKPLNVTDLTSLINKSKLFVIGFIN